ncbi:MAG: hypothetical protein PHY43_02705 [Verrucomicrobiales bacterium]|nr:hypothetical protein [Verrucomicrobiales bacterium]
MNNPGMVFMVMSNELSTPKIVYCPSDSYHNTYASNFVYLDLLGVAAPALNQKAAPQGATAGKVSYFINGDASEADPQSIMAGDLNIGSDTATAANAAAAFRFGAAANTPTTVSAAQVKYVDGVAFGPNNGAWAWTQNDFHQKSGNIALSDGSVQSVTIAGLHTALQNSTNSAVKAAFCFPN